MSEYRVERDSMGEIRVPAQAYYGAPRTVGVELTYRFGADRI